MPGCSPVCPYLLECRTSCIQSFIAIEHHLTRRAEPQSGCELHCQTSSWGWAEQPNMKSPGQIYWSGLMTFPRGVTIYGDGWRRSINVVVSSGKAVIVVLHPAVPLSFSEHVIAHIAAEIAGEKCCSKHVRGSISYSSVLLFWNHAAIIKIGEVIITKFGIVHLSWCMFSPKVWRKNIGRTDLVSSCNKHLQNMFMLTCS